ncbi:hypothetical protein [Sulfurimonas sp.]|uniref:hypothetical protein n=1 Tax=Sulfurimonas sp. TaxID=2022749 RepID=UPI0025F7BA0E|nr:hypothetical protein [Sulfurimonas sp.]MCK9473839.1 hypothetical protein [Sulfurimonas sp.]
MPQIRNTKIQDIKNQINTSKLFFINDFKLEFFENGNILAKISFRASGKYSFSIEENIVSNSILDIHIPILNQNREKVLQTIEKPGDNKNIEIRNHENLDDCIKRISEWLYNLDEDLKNEFTFENIEEISDIEKFEKKLNNQFTDESERFTQEEKETLLNKINELQERIEKLEQNKNTQKQIELLEQSKNELEKYPKKAWWLKFYNRFNSLNKGLNLVNNIGDNVIKLFEKLGS